MTQSNIFSMIISSLKIVPSLIQYNYLHLQKNYDGLNNGNNKKIMKIRLLNIYNYGNVI